MERCYNSESIVTLTRITLKSTNTTIPQNKKESSIDFAFFDVEAEGEETVGHRAHKRKQN
jgi:hypothetical protein